MAAPSWYHWYARLAPVATTDRTAFEPVAITCDAGWPDMAGVPAVSPPEPQPDKSKDKDSGRLAAQVTRERREKFIVRRLRDWVGRSLAKGRPGGAPAAPVLPAFTRFCSCNKTVIEADIAQKMGTDPIFWATKKAPRGVPRQCASKRAITWLPCRRRRRRPGFPAWPIPGLPSRRP